MVSKSHAKRRQDIKTKLMAAIAMLLVSSIMMVSSTYAWFTLSTAPEVTGINTAVGANGNLEMALLPKMNNVLSETDFGITSSASDSTKALTEKNATWGNLVELSNEDVEDPYGLNNIVLYPAQLNTLDNGNLDTNNFLKTPKYGADGRVSTLEKGGLTGTVDNGQFYPDSYYGVRAVGNASGMTPRQLDYRNAKSSVNNYSSLAKDKAAMSLNNNGSALASIAIEHATAETESYGKTDIEAMRAMLNDLDAALDYIEKAYMNAILAMAASEGTGATKLTDLEYSAIANEVKADGATLTSVKTAVGADKIPAGLSDYLDDYDDMRSAVDTADTALKGLETTLASDASETFDWDDIDDVLTALANPSTMEICGYAASEVKEHITDIANAALSGGIEVVIASGGGIYADIADHCGDYSSSISIEKIEYGGASVGPVGARMKTATTAGTTYLKAVDAAIGVLGSPSSDSATKLPITDMYGYIIDLAFRTNAAESDLLLQVEATDRIYSDNTNEETMGHGSTMTFAASAEMTTDQIKGLMKAIRIVFFDPTSGTIYVNGKLDADNAAVGADGYTAEIQLYGGESTYQKNANGTGLYGKVETDAVYEEITDPAYSGDKYSVNEGVYTLDNVNGTHYLKTPAKVEYKLISTLTDYTGDTFDLVNKIVSLPQNTAKAVSVLVYLDGEAVTNKDVAAKGQTSLTGSMNLQFASSATLVPMEYGDLHIQEKDSNTQATQYDVTLTGATGNAKATAGTDYTFTLANAANTNVVVTIGGQPYTGFTVSNGTYTIPGSAINGVIEITATATNGG